MNHLLALVWVRVSPGDGGSNSKQIEHLDCFAINDGEDDVEKVRRVLVWARKYISIVIPEPNDD